MYEQLRLLVELQKLDSEIISKSRALEGIPLKLKAVEKAWQERRSAFEKEKDLMTSIDKKKREKERELAESNERVSKLRARTAEIKDNKAYQAHLKEIETAEKHSYQIEDEILALMEAAEDEAKKVREAERRLSEEGEQFEREKKALEEQMKASEGEVNVLRAKRKEFTGSLEKEHYDLYMSLLQSTGGLAVTEAKDEVCTGCNMNIMPQLFVEIKKNATVTQCPQCRRILFYKEPAEQPPPPGA